MDTTHLRTEFEKQIADADRKITSAQNTLKQLQEYKTKLLGGIETLDLLEPKDEIDAILKDTIESTIGMILTNQYSDVPATPAPKFSDTFSWICQDNSVVEESSELYG